MTDFPNKLSFLSDDTEAKLVNETKPSKERTANYVYTKASCNLGKEFTMSLEQIKRLKDSKLIVCNEYL
jgi:hypothetical protein